MMSQSLALKSIVSRAAQPGWTAVAPARKDRWRSPAFQANFTGDNGAQKPPGGGSRISLVHPRCACGDRFDPMLIHEIIGSLDEFALRPMRAPSNTEGTFHAHPA